MSPESDNYSEVIQFDEKLRQREKDRLLAGLESFHTAGQLVVQEYAELMVTDQKSTLNQISEYIQRVRSSQVADGVSSSFIEAVAGGPNPDAIMPILNIAATQYSRADQGTRRLILEGYWVGLFHTLNFVYAQDHVEHIQNPHVLRDIIINEPLFWPGYAREAEFLKSQPTIEEFRDFGDDQANLTLLFYGVIMKHEEVPLPIKEQLRNSPELLNGVLDMVAGFIFHDAARKVEHYDSGARDLVREDIDLIEEIERRLSKADPRYHEVIRQKIAGADWVQYRDFDRYSFPPTTKTKLDYIDGRLVYANNRLD